MSERCCLLSIVTLLTIVVACRRGSIDAVWNLVSNDPIPVAR